MSDFNTKDTPDFKEHRNKKTGEIHLACLLNRFGNYLVIEECGKYDEENQTRSVIAKTYTSKAMWKNFEPIKEED